MSNMKKRHSKRKPKIDEPATSIRAKISKLDLTTIQGLQQQATKAFGCADKGKEKKGLCYWFGDGQPVFRCDLVDCMLFLLKVCPYRLGIAAMSQGEPESKGDESEESRHFDQ